MPTTYSDIAVVTSPKIQITDERIEIVESTLLELKPFIEGMYSNGALIGPYEWLTIFNTKSDEECCVLSTFCLFIYSLNIFRFNQRSSNLRSICYPCYCDCSHLCCCCHDPQEIKSKFWTRLTIIILSTWKFTIFRPWERLSKLILRFHFWKQKKSKVKRNQLEMLVPLSAPSAVKKIRFYHG